MQNISQKQISQQIESIYKDNLWQGANVETKIIESKSKDVDYDEINQDNITYSRYNEPSHQQQSQDIKYDNLDAQKSIKKFNEISEESQKKKYQLQKSRQAQISNRLVKIREEIYKLETQLNSDNKDSEQSQSKQKETQLYLKHLTSLKEKLTSLQSSKGFNILAKNQKHLLQLTNNENQTQNITKSDLDKILNQLQNQKQDKKDGQSELTIVLDKSKQDLGVLIRLNNLYKRMNFIQYVVGDWKPTTKNKDLTSQVEFLQKRIDLLDPVKLEVIRRKSQFLNEELRNLEANKEEFQQIGHNKDNIDELHDQASKVKETMNNISKVVERLEQKKKIHNMCAQVLIDIETLENQQNHILNSCKENQQLLQYVEEGINANVEIIKSNTEYLKSMKKGQ